MTSRLAKNSVFALLLMTAAVALCACNMGNQQPPQPAAFPDTRAADETLIRNIDAEWVKTVAGKDAQQSSSYYADDGVLMAPGASLASGREEIQRTWAGMLATPGFALSFVPAKVTVSRSGDLAYEVGDYELTTNDKKGKPQTVKAKYVVVWGKQADGRWKALVDAPTTTHWMMLVAIGEVAKKFWSDVWLGTWSPVRTTGQMVVVLAFGIGITPNVAF